MICGRRCAGCTRRELEGEPIGTFIQQTGAAQGAQVKSVGLARAEAPSKGWQSVVQLNRRTESGEAPGSQGATTENIGNI